FKCILCPTGKRRHVILCTVIENVRVQRQPVRIKPDLPLRMMAAEITREKLMLRLHQELPYQLTVETESWQEREDGSARVDQLIYVARDGHKGIVLGKKGETIKAVSQAARVELEDFLGRRIHLFMQVKVRRGWLEEADRYAEMGLEFKDGA
ncbi:MAG: KH domain-containing protein, partial [Pseudomonadota bacterium]